MLKTLRVVGLVFAYLLVARLIRGVPARKGRRPGYARESPLRACSVSFKGASKKAKLKMMLVQS